MALWLIGVWLFFTSVAMLPLLILDEGSVYLRMQKFRYWALILPPMLVGALAFVQSVGYWVGRKVGTSGSASWRRVAMALITLAILTGSTIMVWPATKRGTLVRNGGNLDYTEFRRFASNFDGGYDMILMNLTRNSASRVLPIYLRSWNGLESKWAGEVRSVRKNYLREPPLGDVEHLIVLDLTKTKKNGRGYPTTIVNYLDDNFEKRFESSSGFILAYTWREGVSEN